jgi:hypothetical protein
MRKLIWILLLGLFLGGCVAPVVTEIEFVESIEIEGRTYVNGVLVNNTISDSLLDDTQRRLGAGSATRTGWEYFWVWHKEDGSSAWVQVVTSDKAGGGDTASYITMTGTYEANIGISYDSIFQWRGGYANWYYSGTESDTGYVSVWYTLQHDTTVLESGGSIQADWTITIAASGTILDTLEWHVAYGIQTGYQEEIDSLRLCYNNGDTNVVQVTPIYDFTNDTLTLQGLDTTRSAANDTLKTVALMDEDGTILSNYVANAYIASGATPKISYKLVITEH